MFYTGINNSMIMKTRPGSVKGILLFCGVALAAVTVLVMNNNNKPGIDSAVATPNKEAVEKPPSSYPLYGFNGNIAHCPLSYSNKDFLDSIATLRPQIIRWPGGIISNIWDWHTGRADGNNQGNKYDLGDVKKLSEAA